MNCKNIKKRLSAYADGELDPQMTQWVEQHIRECSDCHHALEKLKNVYHWIEDDVELDPDPFLGSRIRAGHEKRNSERKSFADLLSWPEKVLVPVTVAAGLLLGIILGAQIVTKLTGNENQASYTESYPEEDIFAEVLRGSLTDSYLNLNQIKAER